MVGVGEITDLEDQSSREILGEYLAQRQVSLQIEGNGPWIYTTQRRIRLNFVNEHYCCRSLGSFCQQENL